MREQVKSLLSAVAVAAVASGIAVCVPAVAFAATPNTSVPAAHPVAVTSWQAPASCGDWAERRSDYADDHGHQVRSNRLDDRADRRSDRQGCD